MAGDDSATDTVADSDSDTVEPTGDDPTSDSAEVQTATATEVPDADEVDAADAAEGEAADAVDADEGAVEPVEQVFVPHRTAGRYLKVAVIAAAALFVGAAAFAGANLQPYLADRAIAHTKFAIAETAANAITTLWTYTPDDMDKLPERSAKYLGGDFANEYRRYIDAIVAPNKQAQISNNTQVMGAAIESLTGDEASAIVYTNSVASTPVTKGAPSLRYISYRLALKRQGADWLITRMSPLTSLDVTPRI
jgi:Mce-associated membrane protein